MLSKQRFLRPETRDYVPKIIAAAIVAKNREQFGFPKEPGVKPGADEAISGDGEIVKVIKTDKPLGDDVNPQPAPNSGPSLISGRPATTRSPARTPRRTTISSMAMTTMIHPAREARPRP